MTYRRNINVEPGAALRELMQGMVDVQDQSRTNAHGIKHMGVDGDTRWTRPDGTEHSVRDIDEIMDQTRAELAEAIANIEELNNVTLPELWEKLEGLEDLGDVQAILDDLDRLESEVKEAGKLITKGPPPADPVIGSTLWVAPNGRVYRAVECEEGS